MALTIPSLWDILSKSQISADGNKLRIQLIEIYQIIAYIKAIYAIFRAFSVAVNSGSRKIWLPAIKKGKSLFQIHPFWVVITN